MRQGLIRVTKPGEGNALWRGFLEEAGEKVVTGEMEQSPGDVGGGPPADAGSGPELLSHTMGLGRESEK